MNALSDSSREPLAEPIELLCDVSTARSYTQVPVVQNSGTFFLNFKAKLLFLLNSPDSHLAVVGTGQNNLQHKGIIQHLSFFDIERL